MSSQDTINQLKKVHIPFWARWRGYFAAKRRRREAEKEEHFVTTVFVHVRIVGTSSVRFAKQWYILKEDGLGYRYYEFGYDDPQLKSEKKSNAEYARIIVPWLHGRYTNKQLEEYGPKTQKANHDAA